MTQTEKELITLVRAHENPEEALLMATLIIIGFLNEQPTEASDPKKEN